MSIERSFNREHQKNVQRKEIRLSVAQRLLLRNIATMAANPENRGTDLVGARRLRYLNQDLRLDEAQLLADDAAETNEEIERNYKLAVTDWANNRVSSKNTGVAFNDDFPSRPKLVNIEEGKENFLIRVSLLEWLRQSYADAKYGMVGTPDMICDLADELGIETKDPDEVPDGTTAVPEPVPAVVPSAEK